MRMGCIKDCKILEGILMGNEKVIKAFYKRNYIYVKRYIVHNSGSQLDAEDVFQDGLVLIYQKLTSDTLEITGSVDTFFYGVCRNIWRNRLRRKKKFMQLDTMYDYIDQHEISYSDVLEDMERTQVYQKYFLKLPDSSKKLLTLFLEGKSMREIARITGYTEKYARKKKFEVKKDLMTMIEKDPMYQELTDFGEAIY